MSRAILAMVFLLAVWLEPTEPARAVVLGYGVLMAYVAWSCLMAAIAWTSWWWDFRLARLVHTIDIGVFIAAVFLTETSGNDFSSPFIAFTAFLLITAAVRWGWSGVALTALALMVSYGAAGGAIFAMGLGIDLYQFGRRLTYMIALSIMMTWLSTDERVTRLVPIPDPGGIPGKRRPQVIAGALAHARQTFHARGAAIAVTRSEEPWVDLFRNLDGVFVHERVGPGAVTEDFGPEIDAALFDTLRQHRIVSLCDHRLRPVSGPFVHALADACQVSHGLLAGFTSASSRGQVLVWGIPDPCIDDLPVIGALAREVGQTLDREEMAVLAQSLAVSGVRNALARDLHDSMAQFLAGTLFRLEALRRWIREGHDPDTEIDAMKEALRGEQGNMRSMIDRLRRGIEGDRDTDIVAELETLMVEVGQHWQITTSLCSESRPLTVSIGLAHELRQLVREAVANAVRHGASSKVALSLECKQDGLLQITIGDNGKGFPTTAQTCRPRSISERIEALGGRLRIASGVPGVRLDIELPLRTLA